MHVVSIVLNSLPATMLPYRQECTCCRTDESSDNMSDVGCAVARTHIKVYAACGFAVTTCISAYIKQRYTAKSYGSFCSASFEGILATPLLLEQRVQSCFQNTLNELELHYTCCILYRKVLYQQVHRFRTLHFVNKFTHCQANHTYLGQGASAKTLAYCPASC